MNIAQLLTSIRKEVATSSLPQTVITSNLPQAAITTNISQATATSTTVRSRRKPLKFSI